MTHHVIMILLALGLLSGALGNLVAGPSMARLLWIVAAILGGASALLLILPGVVVG